MSSLRHASARVNPDRVAYPVRGSAFEVELRRFMGSIGYTRAAVRELLDHIEAEGTASACPALDVEDTETVNELFMRHASLVECDPRSWPPVFDEACWMLGDGESPEPTPEPFQPSPEDVSWADRMARYDAEDMEYNASLSAAVDFLCEGLVPADGGRHDDHDMARCGAVG